MKRAVPVVYKLPDGLTLSRQKDKWSILDEGVYALNKSFDWVYKKLFFIVNGRVMSVKEIAELWGVSYKKHRGALLRKLRNEYNWHEFTREEVKVNETTINF